MSKSISDPLARIGGEQGTLFGLPPAPPRPVYGGEPPARDTDTSKAAAEKQRSKAPTIRTQLLAFARSRGVEGITAEEAGAFLAGLRGLPEDNPACRLSAAARLTELKLGSFLADSGRRRPTRAGCGAIVLTATAKQGSGEVCER